MKEKNQEVDFILSPRDLMMENAHLMENFLQELLIWHVFKKMDKNIFKRDLNYMEL